MEESADLPGNGGDQRRGREQGEEQRGDQPDVTTPAESLGEEEDSDGTEAVEKGDRDVITARGVDVEEASDGGAKEREPRLVSGLEGFAVVPERKPGEVGEVIEDVAGKCDVSCFDREHVHRPLGAEERAADDRVQEEDEGSVGGVEECGPGKALAQSRHASAQGRG